MWISPGQRRSTTIGAALAVIASASIGMASCGGEDASADSAAAPVTVETFCDDYLKHPAEERPQAVADLVTQLGAPSTVDWHAMVEQRCATAPDLKLGDFFNHFR